MPQPSNSWSVQLVNPDGSLNGTPQTLAALGIESARFTRRNMTAHTLQFIVGGETLDAATLWPYGQLLALLKPDGTRFFFGRVEPWSRDAIGGNDPSQNHIGIVINPWWYFRIIYQQTYNLPSIQNGQIVYTKYTTPRDVLYVLWNSSPSQGNLGFFQANTGQQIADAVNWAITQGAPIKLGKVDPTTTPFSSFQKGIPIEQVIKHAYRFEPDFNVVWDYTTLPFPTINFLKQQSMVPLTIDLTAPGVREKVTIKERPDWQRSYVAIFYDETQTIGNETYLDLAYDYWPNPLTPPDGMSQTEFNFRGVDLFCDLSGEKIGIQNQQANFASLPYDITSISAWRKWKPHIDPNVDPTIDSSFIVTTTPSFTATSPDIAVNGTLFQASCSGYASPAINTQDELDNLGNPVAFDNTCAFEVTDGSWADWIPNSNGQRVRATAFALVIHKLPANAPAGTNPKWEIVPLSHDFTAVNLNTNGISQDFTQKTSTVTQYAEPQPIGLAKSMYTSWQNLALEGSFQNTEAVIGSSQPISENNCLNFKTPNQPKWVNANAIIQEISGDIATGVTEVHFGAPLFLSGNELIDVIRATVKRVTTINLDYIFGGPLSTGSGTTRMSRKHHARHAQQGDANKQIETIGSQPSASLGSYISFDPTVSLPAGLSGIFSKISSQSILNAWNANPTPPTS